MIETRDLTKMYGELYALNRLNLKLEKGDVYGFISTSMPEGNAGSLKPDEYAAVIAYFLRMGGFPVGADDMPADKAVLATIGIVSNPK